MIWVDLKFKKIKSKGQDWFLFSIKFRYLILFILDPKRWLVISHFFVFFWLRNLLTSHVSHNVPVLDNLFFSDCLFSRFWHLVFSFYEQRARISFEQLWKRIAIIFHFAHITFWVCNEKQVIPLWIKFSNKENKTKSS